MLSLRLAIPRFYIPGAAVSLVASAFPEVLCDSIEPCRLLAPPCYDSMEEFEAVLRTLPLLDPWAFLYWETHQEVLTPEASDDVDLQARLESWLARLKPQQLREQRFWRMELARLQRGSLPELGMSSEGEREERVKEAAEQVALRESIDRIDGIPTAGWLTLTLEEVRCGVGGLRDPVMIERWARKNGLDLNDMARERADFAKWLARQTGTPCSVIEGDTGCRAERIRSPNLCGLRRESPQFLEACARVRYRARFPDAQDTTLYLEACEVRKCNAVEELREAVQLRTALAAEGEAGPQDEPEQDTCRFKFCGAKRWKVSFLRLGEFTASGQGVGHELAFVLRHPHHEYHVLELHRLLAFPTAYQHQHQLDEALDAGLSVSPGTHAMKNRAIKREEYDTARRELEGKMKEAKLSGDRVAIEDAEERLARLDKYQAEARHSVPDPAKRCNDRFQKGLQRFKTALMKDGLPGAKAFLEHLDRHLTVARFKVSYQPPEGFRWEE